MAYVYHRKPSEMRGSTLFPLNMLTSIDEEIYRAAANKYEGRAEITKQLIPKLDCLWNDVIHCLPIHPARVYEALAECGFSPPERLWYQIDVGSIMRHPCAWFAFRTSPPIPIPSDEVTILATETFQELDTVPEATRKWYRYLAEHRGEMQLTYRYIPHVFVQGPIDVSNAAIVEWSIPCTA